MMMHPEDEVQAESAAYLTLMKTVESLQADLQETITTCHSLREANTRLSKGYEAAKAEAVRQREKFHVTRTQLVEATKAKIESDRNTELVVSKWKAQLDERTKELDILRGKLVPQDLDMLRIEIQDELEGPHQQKLAELEGQIQAAQRSYFDCRRELETVRAEFDQHASSQSAAIANEKLRGEAAVEALRSRLKEAEHKLSSTTSRFAKEKREIENEVLELRVKNDVLQSELTNLQKAAAMEKENFVAQLAEKVQHAAQVQTALTMTKCDLDQSHRDKDELEAHLVTLRTQHDRREADLGTLRKSFADQESRARTKEKHLMAKLEDARFECAATKKDLEREKEDVLRFEAAVSRRRDALELEVAELRRTASEARNEADDRIEAARTEARTTLAGFEDRLMAAELARSDLEKSHDAALADAIAEKRKLEAQLKIERARATQLETEIERTLKPQLSASERDREALLASFDDLQRKTDRLDDLENSNRIADRKLDEAASLQAQFQRQIHALEADLQDAAHANDRLKQAHASDLADLKKALKADRLAAASALKAETDHLKQQADDKLRKERKKAHAYKERALRERDRTSPLFCFLSLFFRCDASQGRPVTCRQRSRRRRRPLHPLPPHNRRRRHYRLETNVRFYGICIRISSLIGSGGLIFLVGTRAMG